MLVRCVFTVFSLISSLRAMSLFGSPSTSSTRTSDSRADSSSAGSGSDCAVRMVRAARGSTGDSPLAAARMPSATSSAVTSFSR